MQSIPAGTTVPLTPDSITADTLGDGWVVILLKPDGSDDHFVGLAGGGNGPPQWAVYTQDSPNIRIYAPASTPASKFRAVAKQVVGGSVTGSMYNVAFTVIPAPTPVIPVPSLTATPALPGNVPSIILAGF